MSAGWQNQETVYLVMWRSRRSGATLSELRKSEAGLNRLLQTLEYLGYDRDEIIVVEKEKAWKPDKLGGMKKKKVGER